MARNKTIRREARNDGLVVKIQRSLASSEPGPETFLITSQDDRVLLEMPASDALVGLFAPSEVKIYVSARLVPDGRGGKLLNLGKRQPEQAW